MIVRADDRRAVLEPNAHDRPVESGQSDVAVSCDAPVDGSYQPCRAYQFTYGHDSFARVN